MVALSIDRELGVSGKARNATRDCSSCVISHHKYNTGWLQGERCVGNIERRGKGGRKARGKRREMGIESVREMGK